MKVVTLVISLLASVASTAIAAPQEYALSKDHTDVSFRISHAGYTMKHGWFGDISGSLKLDEARLEASSVDITIATNSVATNHAKRDKDLQSPSFLDAVQFPTMHFVSTNVVPKGDNKLDVTGTLTLHGVTRPLTLQVITNKIGPSPFGKVQTAGFSATATLKRSDYGMNTMIPMIGDEVAIEIDAEFGVPKAP